MQDHEVKLMQDHEVRREHNIWKVLMVHPRPASDASIVQYLDTCYALIMHRSQASNCGDHQIELSTVVSLFGDYEYAVIHVRLLLQRQDNR
jgi:hypothetical protein